MGQDAQSNPFMVMLGLVNGDMTANSLRTGKNFHVNKCKSAIDGSFCIANYLLERMFGVAVGRGQLLDAWDLMIVGEM